MAAPQVSKASPEASGQEKLGVVTEAEALLAGEAIFLSPAVEQQALSQLLLLRCADSRLIGSQVVEQAKLCGQAVKAAFKELHAVDAEE